MIELELVRDVLDKQLIDRNEIEMGRVDGVVLDVPDDGPPRLDSLELGLVVLAERFHPRLRPVVEWLRRFSVRTRAVQRVPWETVAEIRELHMKVAIDATETAAFEWELWLGKHVVEHLPGGKEEE
jgi:hypothetical protein